MCVKRDFETVNSVYPSSVFNCVYICLISHKQLDYGKPYILEAEMYSVSRSNVQLNVIYCHMGTHVSRQVIMLLKHFSIEWHNMNKSYLDNKRMQLWKELTSSSSTALTYTVVNSSVGLFFSQLPIWVTFRLPILHHLSAALLQLEGIYWIFIKPHVSSLKGLVYALISSECRQDSCTLVPQTLIHT